LHDGFSCPSCDIVERLKKELEILIKLNKGGGSYTENSPINEKIKHLRKILGENT